MIYPKVTMDHVINAITKVKAEYIGKPIHSEVCKIIDKIFNKIKKECKTDLCCTCDKVDFASVEIMPASVLWPDCVKNFWQATCVHIYGVSEREIPKPRVCFICQYEDK